MFLLCPFHKLNSVENLFFHHTFNFHTSVYSVHSCSTCVWIWIWFSWPFNQLQPTSTNINQLQSTSTWKNESKNFWKKESANFEFRNNSKSNLFLLWFLFIFFLRFLVEWDSEVILSYVFNIFDINIYFLSYEMFFTYYFLFSRMRTHEELWRCWHLFNEYIKA